MQHMTYRPGRQCVASYDIEFAGGSIEGTRTLVVTLAKDERLTMAFERVYGGTVEAGRAVYLPAERCLIEAFPLDYEVSSLGRAWDTTSASALLREAGIRCCGGSLAVETLSYRPHEACVLAYEGQTQAGAPLRLIGKAMREPYKAEHVHLVAQTVASQLDDSVVQVARTYRPETERRLVFMDHAYGVSLHQAYTPTSRGRSCFSTSARSRLLTSTALGPVMQLSTWAT